MARHNHRARRFDDVPTCRRCGRSGGRAAHRAPRGSTVRHRRSARRPRRHRHVVPVELEQCRRGLSRPARSRRVRRRAGVAALGARRARRAGLPVVAGLPTRLLPPRRDPPGYSRRVRRHGRHLSRRGRAGVRRRGRQPHDGPGRVRHRQCGLRVLPLRLRRGGLRLRRLPPLWTQRRRQHRRLPRPVGGPELRARQPRRPRHRLRVRARPHRRLPQRPALPRRRRVPHRRGQAHARRGRRRAGEQARPARLRLPGGPPRRRRADHAGGVPGQRRRLRPALRPRPGEGLQLGEARVPA